MGPTCLADPIWHRVKHVKRHTQYLLKTVARGVDEVCIGSGVFTFGHTGKVMTPGGDIG